MESTNLHIHHIEGSDSSQVQTSSSCFSVGNNDHASSHWKSSNLLVESSNNIHSSGCEDQAPNNNPMVQELSFVNWPNNAINPSSFPQLIPNIKIKQESLPSNHRHNLDNYSSSFQKLSDLLKYPSSNNSPPLSDDQMPLVKTHMLTNNYHPNNNNFPSLLDGNKELITNFSHIFPSVNISNLIDNDSSSNNMASSFSLSSNSSTLEMNDLQEGSNNHFGSARLISEGSEINQPPPNSHLIEIINGTSSTFDVDHTHRQQSSDLKLWNSSNNLSSFNNDNGVQGTKRSSSNVEHNKSTMPKKARFEASCPPLKVRKEKLGDRIAALQQLVAPFGKTDTASVLMEAIGYIQFLQNQVETLSVPYMKLSSHNKSNNNITERVSDDQNMDDEPKQDLRSRGLCLVPVSCMSYLASDAGNGGVWLPSNFNPSF